MKTESETIGVLTYYANVSINTCVCSIDTYCVSLLMEQE